MSKKKVTVQKRTEKDIKSEIYDVLAQQEFLRVQFNQLQERKQTLLKELKEVQDEKIHNNK